MPATPGLPACKRHDDAARAKCQRRCQVETREKAGLRDAASDCRAAAVTSPGDMIAPGETPDRRSLAISDDARL
jgi:hypothetical protein